MKKHSAIFAATCSAIAVQDGAVPNRIQLFALGENRTHNGHPRPSFFVDSVEHGQQIIDATKRALGESQLMGDYDHQAAATIEKGTTAIASGWIDPETLTVDETGVWGDVEWTAKAAAHIAAKEYRYVSPYFLYRPDGRISSIINFALVNVPNFDLAAVASALADRAALTTEENEDMKFVAIASALGLAATVDETAIIAAITEMKGKADALAATASALGVTVADDLGVVATAAASAIAASKPDPAKYVPVEAVTEMKAAMSGLQAKVDGFAKARRDQMIADAADRLPPALKAHAEGIEDEAALASFLGGFPENGLGKSMDKKREAGGDTLTDEEKAICSQWNLTEDEYLKSRKQLEGAQ